jgi:serine phosphatase RsbU (regulator of sigma subunit)
MTTATLQDVETGLTCELLDAWTRTPSKAAVEIPTMLPQHSIRDWVITPKVADAQSLSVGRQAIHEREDVRRVSARMFPRNLPQLASLVYAAVCVEARDAGGDFYDFFDRGAHRLGFAIGDVAGKGMASALVRATLQASLRTACTLGGDDFQESLALVNRLLFESTPEPMYATLFFADYDEETRHLRYVNCGHPAPLLYRHNRVLRLDTTSQVLGLFSDWKGTIGEVQLWPGDTLLVYTDGITEATDDAGEEFGEGKLLAMWEAQSGPLSAFLRQCVQEVCRFGASDQRDDLTLMALPVLEV